MARARMAVLYDRSVSWRGLVVGTGNKTESLIGYTTIFGDNACAFNPIGDLYKSQVRQLALAIGVPEAIVRKAPSADLWPGQTDEIEGGFSYPLLDRLLFWRVDKRRSTEELAELGFDAASSSGWTGSSPAPSSSARSRRSPSSGRGRPASTTCTRDDGRARPPGERRRRPTGGRRDAVRRRHADRQPRRHHAAGDRDAQAVPLIAAEDTRHTHRLLERHGIATRTTSYHARSGPGRLEALLRAPARRARTSPS